MSRDEVSRKVKEARKARGEELWGLIRERHPDILTSAAMNRNLTDDMAAAIGRDRNTPPKIIGMLTDDVRFKTSYKVKLSITKNPMTPIKVALPLLKFLRIFDLADLTRDRNVPTVLRQKVELIVVEKIAGMPSGVKKTLSRRANTNIAVKLMERSPRDVIEACLDNPLLIEGDMYRVLNMPATKADVVRAVAVHRKWSLRYLIRFALIRNFHTPMERVAEFVRAMKTSDLKELYVDPKLPNATKPFIFRELHNRKVSPKIEGDKIYVLGDEEAEHPSLGEMEAQAHEGGFDGPDGEGEEDEGEEIFDEDGDDLLNIDDIEKDERGA